MILRIYKFKKNDYHKYAIIISKYKGKYIFVKHRKRTTWEIPGGKREKNETILEAAKRELFEETSAIDFEIKEICDYSVTSDNNVTKYGRLYYAKIKTLKEKLEFEIEKIELLENLPKELTYPNIQPKLFEKITKI